MAISVCEVSITEAELGSKPLTDDPSAGAIVDFWGAVRGLENGRELEGIEYEAHKAMAEYQMKAIAEAAAESFALTRVEIRHRIGFVPVSQPSVFVRVTSPHRAAGYAGNQWIMEELKRRVPIWKRVVFKEPDAASAISATPSSTLT